MIKLENKGQLLIATLDNSRQGNALGSQEATDLAKMVAQLKRHKLRGLIFTSVGNRFFCAGGNLQEQANSKNKASSLAVQRKIRTALLALRRLDVTTVAIASGDALGGGVELLSAFDRVLSAPHSLFGLWQARLGVSFGWGGMELENRMSRNRLNQLLMHTGPISAFEARQVGLVDEICPEAFLEVRAQAWLSQAIQKSKTPSARIRILSAKNQVSLFEKAWLNPDHKRLLRPSRPVRGSPS